MFTYLTGGARSGKSGLAVRLAARSGLGVTFVATGESTDDEMSDRIARHRAERPSGWVTREVPIEIGAAIETIPPDRFVVLDCLSLWVSNCMFADYDDTRIESGAAAVATVMATRSTPGVVVSNEVGLGIVPESALGRRYRDVLGRVNSAFASRADDGWLCVSGRVVRLEQPPA
jgi:adenosylcobinamide kinase / adenosylcobinamide-phosphate guanylyltransferase